MRNVQITTNTIIKEPYIFVTYTTGIGEVPIISQEFLRKNHNNMVGVASSGNMGWGEMYGKSADIISKMYNRPIILKFELAGSKSEVEKFKQEVVKIAEQYSTVDRIEQ